MRKKIKVYSFKIWKLREKRSLKTYRHAEQKGKKMEQIHEKKIHIKIMMRKIIIWWKKSNNNNIIEKMKFKNTEYEISYLLNRHSLTQSLVNVHK